jgi:hypothetical protein
MSGLNNGGRTVAVGERADLLAELLRVVGLKESIAALRSRLPLAVPALFELFVKRKRPQQVSHRFREIWRCGPWRVERSVVSAGVKIVVISNLRKPRLCDCARRRQTTVSSA